MEADARTFVMFEEGDPTLAALVYEIRYYAPGDIRFGMRYMDPLTIAEDDTSVADLTEIGALEPDIGDRPEPGWTEREEVA
jgi:hypothetical protein